MDDISPSDGALIAAVLAGETEQFSVIVGRYQPALARLAYSRLERADWADDVVQETFLCAYKSLASYDSQYSFRTWLWTILLNQVRRRISQARRQETVRVWSDHATSDMQASKTPNPATSPKESPPEALLAKEQSRRLEQLLSQLPDAQADALRLRFFGGLKFHEIAAAMGCSLSSAKNRVKWGLEKMASLMEMPVGRQ